jgi:hypothetical protein
MAIAVLLSAPGQGVFTATYAPCDGPDADAWVSSLRDRVVMYDGLARFAGIQFGEPIGCEGEVTTEFDGARYGVLTLTFPTGVSLTVETQPIETSIVTLRAASGFESGTAVEAALRAYTAQVGVSIDWDDAEESVDGAETTQTFWDPDSGLNASASLVTSGGALVAVRFSMAL